MNNLDKSEWIATLKQGDEVIVSSRWNKSISKVAKVTPKGAIRLENGDLYNNFGYKKTTDRWCVTSIEPITDAILYELKRKELVGKLKAFNLETLTVEQLKQMLSIIL